eukprot:gene1056-391_t
MLDTAIAEEKETIIMGDLNCNYLKDADHKSIKNTVAVYGFKPQIKEPTQVTSETDTLIDTIASPHPGNVKSSVVLGSSLSDHGVVAIVRKMNCQKIKPRKTVSRNFSNYCHKTFRQDLQAVSWDGVLAQQDANGCCTAFPSMSETNRKKFERCLNKTVSDVFCDHFEKVGHQKATRVNGQNLQIPKKLFAGEKGLGDSNDANVFASHVSLKKHGHISKLVAVVDNNFHCETVREIFDILEFAYANSNLITANCAALPYSGWIELNFSLIFQEKQDEKDSIQVPFLVTPENTDTPIVGSNVLQELCRNASAN